MTGKSSSSYGFIISNSRENIDGELTPHHEIGFGHISRGMMGSLK
jgi:hypothetical protein